MFGLDRQLPSWLEHKHRVDKESSWTEPTDTFRRFNITAHVVSFRTSFYSALLSKAWYMLGSCVCPSVHLSVTLSYCVEDA